ncbi:MAG: hypothetical protein VYB61_11290 [Verrucomicrobiota bacterium]|nr:hypothetical protein [Verrucomicrobiota bacterium]
MPIEELTIHLEHKPLPAVAAAYLEEANRRIDNLFESGRNRRMPRFIPSDAVAIYNALDYITRQDMPLGRIYCEWGSGYGIGTCFAALLGYDAYGIEIEEELVSSSEKLAGEFGIDIRIINTDYMPEGFECGNGSGGAELVTPEQQAFGLSSFDEVPRYEGMEHGLDEVDLFFIYPWPGEQEFVQEFFHAVAADGAILLAYYGDNDLCAYRKTAANFD